MTATAVAAPRRAYAHLGRLSRLMRRAAGLVGSLLLVAAALVLIGLTVAPRVFHYQTATMLTGSMVPTIKPGDVIVDVAEPATDLRVGQIITYHIPVDDHRVESHRIVWVKRQPSGAVLFRTKGDANNGVDPWTARAHGQVWRVRTVVPLLGDAIRFLRRPAVQLLLTRVLPVMLVASVLMSIWRRPRPGDEETAAS